MKFSDVTFQEAVPPERHPYVKYQGFHPGRVTLLKKGHVKSPGHQAFAVDTIYEEDIAVPLRDGVKIYTNVFRPVNEAKVSAILAWAPYGKGGTAYAAQNYDSMGPLRMSIPFDHLSGYERFEGPNPADWTRRGYAVVDPDARGSYNSEGDAYWWNSQEAGDIYDTIDWISKQSWCDGSVVMMGNSWLAISQINVAARFKHPALKAIAPWEALTDTYRDVACRGGRPSVTGFLEMLMKGFTGRGKVEDPFTTLHKQHPFYDEYWEDKSIPVENIDIPMYLTASYSSGIHSHGSFLNFQKARTKQKWLRVHSTQEWYDIYRDEAMEDLARFYDYFTKDKLNGWEKTPKLRLSLLGFNGGIVKTISERPEPDESYPLKRTQMRKVFLDANSKALSASVPQEVGKTSHESHLSEDKSSFGMTFFKYTELSGWPWARLYMSCNEHTDMDVVVIIRKVGVLGDALEHLNYPVHVPITELPNTNVAKYVGPSGYLRASHAVTIEDRKDPDVDYPRYKHDRSEPVEPKGRIVMLDIPIWPIGMVFEKDEGLRIDVAGTDMAYRETEDTEVRPDENEGKHIIHTGGEHASFLTLPYIAG